MLVLASSSPRRSQLLEMLGIPHQVDPSDVPETRELGEPAERMAARLAREKAVQVAARHPGAPVLGADTVVVLGHRLLGKPASPAEACDMLHQLSGREHQVVTAVALARDGDVRVRCDVTRVWFRSLPAELIDAYVAGAGENFHDLIMRNDEPARQLLAQASLYASERLSEIEARSHYLRKLHGSE